MFPQLHCRIIGDGPDRARFEGVGPSSWELRSECDSREERRRAEVADAMRACSVFVLPSRYEGLGCVYLEAMACGKPVMACRGQGIEEIIEHGKNGWLISDWVDSQTTDSDATNSDSRNPINVLRELAQDSRLYWSRPSYARDWVQLRAIRFSTG